MPRPFLAAFAAAACVTPAASLAAAARAAAARAAAIRAPGPALFGIVVPALGLSASAAPLASQPATPCRAVVAGE